VFLAARGSSDNAGLYAKYLWGSLNRLPVALAAPSLFGVYGTPPVVKDMLVVGISQSGESPDIVNVVREGRAQGALTLAITNAPASPLAEASELVLDTGAGPELSVAATKTYTSQLLAIAMLSVGLAESRERREELQLVPGFVKEALSLGPGIKAAGERRASMAQCVVLGRGYNYATAYEWALKLKELAQVLAEPYSSADFQHGPVAIVSGGFPVLAVAPAGAVLPDVLALLSSLVKTRGVELVAVSNDDRVLSLAAVGLRLPTGLPEWLSPLVAIVPAQLFTYHLACARGFDSERPRGLEKVTRTW
jgi:glucosamine--fructose-6-phosphate aminotransferase (isomerizing)